MNLKMWQKTDPCIPKLENSDILKNTDQKLSHIEPSQQKKLKELVYEFKHVFQHIPARNDKIYHGVVLESDMSVKQNPYSMNQVKQHVFKDEVK
jgi:hypothetical protein